MSLVLALSLFSSPELQAFAAALDGAWFGELEYRDYQSDARETIPHLRRVRVSPNLAYATMELAYADPGRVVYDGALVGFRSGAVSIASIGKDGVDRAELSVTRIERLADGFRLVLSARDVDDDAPADVRYEWVLRGDRLKMTKSVRPAGTDQPFRFRNEHRLHREVQR
ncbi:MAG: hypothetical protein AAFX94_17735 [Myxococcota bacterium]